MPSEQDGRRTTRDEFTGPTVEFPTNWQARKLLKEVTKRKENANTKASATHWSQLESRIERALEDSNDE